MKIYSIIGAAAITVAALAMEPAQAHGDPQSHDAALVCRMLDRAPSVAGLNKIVQDMISQGISADAIRATLSLAFNEFCPEYQPVLKAAIDAANGQQMHVAV